MGIEKMSRLSVECGKNMLDDALMICCESGCFQICDSSGKKGAVLSNLNEQNPYAPAYAKIRDMAAALGIEPEVRDFGGFKPETGDELMEWCVGLSSELDKIKSSYDDLCASIEEMRQTDSYVKHLIGLDVSFTDLYEMKYVKVRIGRLPAENLEKLDYYVDQCIHFIPFEKNPTYVWGIYLTPVDTAEFADSLMNSLYFERTRLPDYLDCDAATVDKTLTQAIKDEEELRDGLKQQMDSFAEAHRDEILAALSKAKYRSDCFELRKMAIISSGKFWFSGYCPSSRAGQLSAELEKIGAQTVEVPISRKKASPDVPVRLKNNVVFRPFEMFVKMYGLPSYSGFDPTPYVAATYCIMFGIMFGDVGQGLVVSLLGVILSKLTKNGLAPIMIRIGLFSAAFGVLYGSVFGIETIITPFFHHESVWRFLGYKEQPENIFQAATVLLIAALAIGIVLILISMTFNTVLNFRKRKFGEALFSVNGVAGIMFYASLVIAAACMFMLGTDLFTPPYIICLIVLPLLLIFFKHPLSALLFGEKSGEKTTVGNFIIENFIDLFEAALSFLSNTMSFLRIGGFVLSHAGMMLVVAQLTGINAPGAEITVGTIIGYTIGNILVMGIEGLLVGIQVLRLEFYEIFNRFYDGGGQSFRPIEIQFESEIGGN